MKKEKYVAPMTDVIMFSHGVTMIASTTEADSLDGKQTDFEESGWDNDGDLGDVWSMNNFPSADNNEE